MTTATRPPQVWRGYDALALADEPIGAHYSPNALRFLRWLVDFSGATWEELRTFDGRRSHKIVQMLGRLHELELVARDRDERWWLTEHGAGLVALVDEEGIE